jgi:hypothetical protein
MSVPRTVAEVLREHVTLEVQGIDRMYLNVYVPDLQREQGVVWFLRHHRGHPFASSALMDPISKAFVAGITAFVAENDIPLLPFVKGQRKDDVAAQYRAAFKEKEGVLFVGRAQEKTPVFRTEKRTNPSTGRKYPWIVRSTAMVNHYYFYCIDEDFGPFFLKFCSYFPYNAKLCVNGHEYVKRQLAKEGIAYEALDNGIRSCADPKRLQQICDDLSAAKIDGLLRKWLARLPHPFTPEDRAAGYRYDISILQAEFSLTQVLDRPATGRVFFEEIIRENLDIGRPDFVQLIFKRPITKRTPGLFRTRVVTKGVTPSLYINYKGCHIKQYHKEGRALRTETTIHNARDFGTRVGKRLHNLPVLRQIGFQANRRLLDVQRVSQDCALGEEEFRRVTQPLHVQGQRSSALRYADPRVLALLSALLVFRLLPRGFANYELREHLAPLLGKDPSEMTQGCMTYQLRRLRLHGLIVRQPRSHRYEVTQRGFRIALFFTRSYARLLRPGLAELLDPTARQDSRLRRAADQLEAAMGEYVARAKLIQRT